MTAPETMADILVIGGGINGSAIARDASGRGLSVVLCDRMDLGEGTSSKSSKLIHGGLRYLEYFEFRLVREALGEREILMKTAPHVVWPQEFILPHTRALRPAWMVRLGLFLYDHLCRKRTLPSCHSVDLRNETVGKPLKDSFRLGYSYWDCRSDDARIVALNAVDAKTRGAEVLTRTSFVEARDLGVWEAQLRDELTGEDRTVRAKVIVNAAGPWANGVLGGLLQRKAKESVRNVKGSHIVLPKLYEGDHAYFLQNDDKRILFVIPYEHDYTMIGNTDVSYDEDPPQPVEISPEEVKYMCDACTKYFRKPVEPKDVVWSWSGLRPLYDDGQDDISAITRDYEMHIYSGPNGGNVLSIFGGKITTGRQLAESAMKRLAEVLPNVGPSWTHAQHLPGGNFPQGSYETLVGMLRARYPDFPERLLEGYARRYGTRAWSILEGVRTLEDLGEDFGGLLFEAEVQFLVREEFAVRPDDILWRRTKLGLTVPEEGVARLGEWLTQRAPAARGDTRMIA